MLPSYDILIAGAGPAGCAAAYDLARAGKRVLLLDKRTFPRHKACACGLTRKTLAALRYSVEPIVERTCHEIILRTSNNPGAPHLDSEMWVPTAFSATDKSREVRIHSRKPICAMAVRETFDNFCLQQTLASGANGGSVALKKIETILAIRELPTHIALDITTAGGSETLTTPILIGADGSNGQTRRLASNLNNPSLQFPFRIPSVAEGEESAVPATTVAGWYQHGFALEATIPYTALPARLPQGGAPHDLVFDFAPLPGGYGWLFPKGNHINIGIGAFTPAGNPAKLKVVTRQLLAGYTHHKLGLDITTLDPQITHITGQHLGMGGHTYTPQGRILLTGDAAGLVDPLTGEGIHSAIVSGQAAAAAILSNEADVAAAYARNLHPLQQTLAFSHRAACAFYAEPERGFRIMRMPILRSLVLKTYADGLPHTKLLGALARLVA